MPRYSEEFKEQMVRKMMPPNAQSVAQISRESGVSEPTLYTWRNQYRHEGKAVPADPANPENWSGADKLAVVIETAALNEEQLSEYCRRKGLYPEQISEWREACEQANDWDRTQNKKLKESRKDDEKRIKALERELRQKEKALAETAALLMLRKKAEAIWGEGEDA